MRCILCHMVQLNLGSEVFEIKSNSFNVSPEEQGLDLSKYLICK